MSASKDKKIRKEQGSLFDKDALTATEAKKRKKNKVTAIIVIAVVVLAFLGGLYINSGHIRANTTAVEVGGVDISPAQYNYYFNNVYYEYQQLIYSNLPDMASYMLPDNTIPLGSQYQDTENKITWAQYIDDMTIAKIQEDIAIYNLALADNFELSAETQQELDDEIASVSETAELYGYKSLNKYLTAIYGKGMNEDVLRKCITMSSIVTEYSEAMRESFTYSEDELAAGYEEHKNSLDIYDYRYLHIPAETYDAADYGNDEDAAKAAAIADALATAQGYADRIKSEQDMIDIAKEFNAETYAEDDSTLRHYSGESLGSDYGDWIKDASRKNGDVTALEMSNGAYVVYYIAREDNNYPMTSMRQILIMPEEVKESDFAIEGTDVDANGNAVDPVIDTDAYEAAVDAAYEAAKADAEKAYGLFKDAGGTEDALISLMEEYSDDTTEGGLYEDIYKGQMVGAVNDWMFDSSRKVGDYEMVESDEYGWHILYFVGYGDSYKTKLTENKLRSADYTEWTEALVMPEYETKMFFSLTK